MNITEFINNYSNHPVLFVGTGMSLRYLQNSYNWDQLLRKAIVDVLNDEEKYLDLKAKCKTGSSFDFPRLGNLVENIFNTELEKDRKGKFSYINDIFYQNMKIDKTLSRFKIYITEILKNTTIKEEKKTEIAELKRASKNISSIITTNYDNLIETVLNFTPIVGNSILLSNPYGSIYKIHGCINQPDKIILTESDYTEFDQKYELIRAQLLSLFIHNPIIFAGYNLNDANIKKLLKTIFSYVTPNSSQSEKIRKNFLLMEYESGSSNLDVVEHDIEMEGFQTIRINKLKTDDYSSVYSSLSSLKLPVTTLDIRKVQSVVKEIYSGGNIKVAIAEDIETLANGTKILAIGSVHTIKYTPVSTSEYISNYFSIIDEHNDQLISLLNKLKIQSNQYFPVYAFSTIYKDINDIDKLKAQQKKKVTEFKYPSAVQKVHGSIESIQNDESIAITNKNNSISWNYLNGNIPEEVIYKYLIDEKSNKKTTEYRKILCMFDYLKYGKV